tara:strand:- start:24624 stop:25736 length:1113 start_codon:yes stop_codon:yes gene_type:complete
MSDFIPVNTPLLIGNEKKYLNQCIDTGWISSEGPFVKEFEEKFSERVGRQFGVAVANGTVALECAVRALGLQPGDEVIMPTFTIISCIQALINNQLKPVLVDSLSDTWNMDTASIRAKITDKTKAIMVVHTYGLPVEMDAVLSLAKEFNLKVIEDAAEAHGLMYKDKPCGSFGDIGIFSFYPNKLITTGEGGMIVMNDKSLYKQCCYLRNLAFDNPRFVHEDLGYNFRMSNIQAALGLAQLEQLDEFIERKHNMGLYYQNNLQEIEHLQCPIAETPYAKNIYWVFGLIVEKMKATQIMQLLSEKRIGTRPFFYPMHLQPALTKTGLFKEEQYPQAEHISQYGFYLPSGLALTKLELERVVQAVQSILTEI